MQFEGGKFGLNMDISSFLLYFSLKRHFLNALNATSSLEIKAVIFLSIIYRRSLLLKPFKS